MGESTCSVTGCDAVVIARVLCSRHYNRLIRHGTVDNPRPSPERRFWAKVDRSGGPNACWPWMGARARRDGYGRFDHDAAHRAAYRFATGPIPDGLFVCHRCDNPPCVNPLHLWLGAAADNNADRDAKGRHRQANTPETAARGDRNGARLYPERILRGERHPGAKLTDAEVARIRELRGTRSGYSVASEFTISKSRVYQLWERDE